MNKETRHAVKGGGDISSARDKTLQPAEPSWGLSFQG